VVIEAILVSANGLSRGGSPTCDDLDREANQHNHPTIALIGTNVSATSLGDY
jgi:hypothetical protein